MLAKLRQLAVCLHGCTSNVGAPASHSTRCWLVIGYAIMMLHDGCGAGKMRVRCDDIMMRCSAVAAAAGGAGWPGGRQPVRWQSPVFAAAGHHSAGRALSPPLAHIPVSLATHNRDCTLVTSVYGYPILRVAGPRSHYCQYSVRWWLKGQACCKHRNKWHRLPGQTLT
jgi:hypothetical protein